MNKLPPKAEKGKPVRDAWNQLVDWAQSVRILPGLNVRLAHTADGTIISFVPPKQRFTGAFFASLIGDAGVKFSMGTVEGIEPTANGKPISDSEATLRVSPQKIDKTGRSWFGVLIYHKDGKIDPKGKDGVIMEQRDSSLPSVEKGEHFHPVAMLKTDKKGRRMLFQIEYFHLRIAWSSSTQQIYVYPVA